jgi:hypothetical protein
MKNRNGATATEVSGRSDKRSAAAAAVKPQTAAVADDLAIFGFILATCPVCGRVGGCAPERAPTDERPANPRGCVEGDAGEV